MKMIKIKISEDEYLEILEGFSSDFKTKYGLGDKERNRMQRLLNRAEEYEYIEDE